MEIEGQRVLREFDIIERFFREKAPLSAEVVCGIGDDAAVIDIPAGYQSVLTVDTLVEKIHFPTKTDPEDLGHKSLAVSLSDIAAMGATPKTALLAITLPKATEAWFSAFSTGFFEEAKKYDVALIGGNLTKG